MSYIVKVSNRFKKAFKKLSKKYHSLEKDVDNTVFQLASNPFIGADLGNGGT